MKDEQSKEETTKNLPELPLNHIAYSVLRSQGFNQKEASQALKMTPSNGCRIDAKINHKYDLTNSNFIKLASNVVKNVLKGTPTEVRHTDLDKNGNLVEIIKDIHPKHSEKLQAASMVYDRAQPVKRSEAEVNISFIQINLEGT